MTEMYAVRRSGSEATPRIPMVIYRWRGVNSQNIRSEAVRTGLIEPTNRSASAFEFGKTESAVEPYLGGRATYRHAMFRGNGDVLSRMDEEKSLEKWTEFASWSSFRGVCSSQRYD